MIRGPELAFIAKTGEYLDNPASRSLLGHCTDVALAFDALVGRSPRLRVLFDVDDTQLARLTVLAGIHDFGKAWGKWQDYIRGGPRCGHVAPTIAALTSDRELVSALEPILDWFTDPADALQTTLCHHGGPVPEHVWNRYAGTVFDAAAHAEISRVLQHLIKLFPISLADAPQIVWSPRLAHQFIGVLMIADWLGSSLRLLDEPDPVRRKLVHAYLRHAGFRRPDIKDPDMGMTSWRPMQEAVGSVALAQIMLIEDMTGSGKTEAAMRLALRHVFAGNADAIRFCVPTRSAATELHSRIAQLAAAADSDLLGCVVRAVPGMLDVDHVSGEPEPDEPRPWSITGIRKTGIAPIAVGTVDQALLAVLRVRHSWARRAMDARSVLIIDEVHAGDPYMIALVETLTLAHPGPVILMTATLGTAARKRLLGKQAGERDATYPALWAGSSVIPIKAVAPRRYTTEILPEDVVLSQVSAAVAQGARVLVIRSTVADALGTRNQLMANGVVTHLHHSRYSAIDRAYLDGVVLGLIGKGAPQGEGCAIVATQTCEQSLDIDADLLITDACPADVMLQRAGRCHRHKRPRPPGYETARILVIDPGNISERLTGNAQRPQIGANGQGWAWVYEALPVSATLNWLREHPDIHLPEDARSFVDAATHPDELAVLANRGPKWNTAWTFGLGVGSAARQLAELSVVDVDRPYSDQPVDPDSHVSTRLGEMPVNVRTSGLRSPFTDALIDCIPVPWSWIGDADRTPQGDVFSLVEGSRLSVGKVAMVYTMDGLHKAKGHHHSE